MKNYIELLKNENILRRLSFIQLLSYFGAWFSNIAIYTLLLKLDVSAEVVAFVAMLHFLAGVFQAPFSGAIIDSIAPKKLMLSILIIEMVSTFGLMFIDSLETLPLLYLLIFIKMAGASFYFTTEMSLLPKILKGKSLQQANELHSMIWSLSYTFGMAISGFFVFLFGIKFAFMFDAMMFFIAFLLLFSLKIDIQHISKKENIFFMMKDSFLYIKSKPKVFHLIFIHSFVGLTAFDALVALMVDKYYASIIATSLALGLLHSFRAIGLVIGPMILSKYINNKKLFYIFLSQGFAIWVWSYFMDIFYLSILASVFVGFFTTTLWSYSYTLLQKNIDENYYGRVVSYNDMLFLIISSLTSYLSGYLYEYGFSLESILFIIGSCFIIGGFYYKWIIKNINLN